MHKLRRVLSGLDSHQAIDLLMSQLRKTKNNYEFLVQVSKTAPGAPDGTGLILASSQGTGAQRAASDIDRGRRSAPLGRRDPACRRAPSPIARTAPFGCLVHVVDADLARSTAASRYGRQNAARSGISPLHTGSRAGRELLGLVPPQPHQ